jgi:hypothetical protein
MVSCIKSSHVSEQSLSSADIGSRFFPSNMLFPCLHRHPIGRVPIRILRNANYTSGHLAFILLKSCKVGSMRAAKPHWHTKSLRISVRDMSAHFFRSFHDS